MSDELPPYDSSPENLLELCEVLREGSMEEDDLLESVEMKETAFDQNLEYGIQLQFISEEGDALKATTRGQEYGYGNLPPDREEGLFRSAIEEHTAYREYLDLAADEIQEINDQGAITRDSLTRELRIKYDYDVADRVLESVANTFLKTLGAAGVGTHKTGRHSYPTRVEVADNFNDFRMSVIGGADEEVDASDEEDILVEKEAPAEEAENDLKEDRNEESTSIGAPNIGRLLNECEISSGGVELSININISSEDWGSDDVVKLVNAIIDHQNS